MTDVNVHSVSLFDADNFFAVPLANMGSFNPPAGGDFIASVLFKLPGTAVPVGDGGDNRHLFGQDTDLNGWNLRLASTGEGANNAWGIVATFNGDALGAARFALAEDSASAIRHPGVVERLILASMFYEGATDTLKLYVNGDLVKTVIQNAPYVNLTTPPRLGVSTAAPVISPVDIVGAAFTGIAAGSGIAAIINTFMGEHFRNCVAANNMALILNIADTAVFDFQHRWNARDIVTRKPGKTVKAPNTARDVFVYDMPEARIATGAAIPDTGNFGFTSNAASQVPLIATATTELLAVRTTENPGWYQGSITEIPAVG